MYFVSGKNDEETIAISNSGQNGQVGYDDEDTGCGSCVGTLIWLISMLLICCTFPFSLFVTVKQVQVKTLRNPAINQELFHFKLT